MARTPLATEVKVLAGTLAAYATVVGLGLALLCAVGWFFYYICPRPPG
jgi:hypothetical protein